jgi:integrase
MRRRGQGEGHIRKRADGRYEAILSDGTKNGRRVRRSLFGRTRAEAAEKLAAALERKRRGQPTTASKQTVADFLDGWLADTAAAKVRPRTLERYEGLIRIHIKPAIGSVKLTALEPRHVQALLNAKSAAGLAPQSVKHIRTVLSSALGRAMKWELVSRNVAALTDAPTIEREDVKPLSPEDARKLLDAAQGHQLEALYSVALALGLRRGEGLGLRWEDVDLDARTLKVLRSLQRIKRDGKGSLDLVPLKTKRSRREMALPDEVVKALRRHRARQAEQRLVAGPRWHESGLVFTTSRGTPVEPRNAVRHFKALLKKAGIAEQRFHNLRHTAASLLLAQGVHPRVVMEVLGHSRISLTMDVYSHVMPTALRDAAEAMNAVLTGRR